MMTITESKIFLYLATTLFGNILRMSANCSSHTTEILENNSDR